MKIVYILLFAVVAVICAATAGLMTANAVSPASLANPDVGLANPAAVYCTEQGYGYEIRRNSDGSESGICILPDGTERDAWEVYSEAHPNFRVPARDERVEYGGMVMLTEAENGSIVEMDNGRVFAVRLQENPTTGYLWTLAVPEGVVEDSESFQPPDEEVAGAGGVRTWTMHVEEPGTYVIAAQYQRSSEETPGDTFSITVVVP